MSQESEAGLGWKVFATLSAVLAAFVARKLLTFAWEKTTGRQPPENPEDPDVEWREAVGWAMLSGVAIGLARLVASRQAATTWQRASGRRPPGLEADRAQS